MKKFKIRIVIIFSVVLILMIFIIFINIPFEIEFILVDKYHMGDDIYSQFAIFTNVGYRTITQIDIDGKVRFVRDQEFTDYVNAYEYTKDSFLIFSSRYPIKKATYKHNQYLENFLEFFTAHSGRGIPNPLRVDIELDESVEADEYYYLYEVKK